MIGIYKFVNVINQKVYVGQSVDIDRRVAQHKYSSFNENSCDYDTRFHQAIRKHGFENFDFSVLVEFSPDEYSQELLDNLEKHYIQLYDSYNYEHGYNATLGGQVIGNTVHKGEANGRALLKSSDVEDIRLKYNAHIPFREVYREYQDKISKRGLQKVWYFDTWKDIYPEFNTEENKHWHSHNAKANSSSVAANNKRSFTPEEVKQMRLKYQEGLSPIEIQRKFYPDKAYSTVRNMLIGATYKDIK